MTTKSLLLDHSYVPSPIDQCNVVNPITNETTGCSSKKQEIYLTTLEAPYSSEDANIFLHASFPNALEGDEVVIVHQGWKLNVETNEYEQVEKNYLRQRWYLQKLHPLKMVKQFGTTLQEEYNGIFVIL